MLPNNVHLIALTTLKQIMELIYAELKLVKLRITSTEGR